MTEDVATRFWSKVNVKSESECWEWSSYLNNKGYGVLLIDGKTKLAHRVSLELSLGKSLGKICALHKCDNPKCVNPKHLFSGTQADNIRDMVSKGRRQYPRGEKSIASKLTFAQVEEIRSMGKSIPATEIAAKYGVNKVLIWNILANRQWKSSNNEGADI